MKNDASFMHDLNILIVKLSKLYGLKANLSLFDSKRLNLEEVMTLLDTDYKMFSAPYININKTTTSPHLNFLKELIVRTLDYSLIGDLCEKHMNLWM